MICFSSYSLLATTTGALIVIRAVQLLQEYRLWYAPDGVLPHSVWKALYGQRRLYGALDLPPSAPRRLLVLQVGLVSMIVLGGPPLCLLLLLACMLLVNMRNPFIIYGGDNVLTQLTLLLCVASCLPDPDAATISLLSIQLSVIYLYAFIAKILSPSWRRGTALSYIINNPSLTRNSARSIIAHKNVLALITWASLVLEATFATIALVSPSYQFLIAMFGILFHVGIWGTLSVGLFGPIMIVAWIPLVLTTGGMEGGIVTKIYACFAILVPLISYWTRAFPPSAKRPHLVGVLRFLGIAHTWSMFSGLRPGSIIITVEYYCMGEAGEVRSEIWYGPNTDARNHRKLKFAESLHTASASSVRAAFAAYIARCNPHNSVAVLVDRTFSNEPESRSYESPASLEFAFQSGTTALEQIYARCAIGAEIVGKKRSISMRDVEVVFMDSLSRSLRGLRFDSERLETFYARCLAHLILEPHPVAKDLMSRVTEPDARAWWSRIYHADRAAK